MQLRNSEYSMHAFEVSHITDNRLLIDIENGHQVRAQVSDVEPAVVAVETLIIKTRCAASQWYISQSPQRKRSGRTRYRRIVRIVRVNFRLRFARSRSLLNRRLFRVP